MDEFYLLEWTFTPENYFEESVDFECDYGLIRFDNGKIELRLDPKDYPDDHSLRMPLHQHMDARFLAAQMLSHKPYFLSKPKLTLFKGDGSKSAWVFPEGVFFNLSIVSTVDVILHDVDGNVIRDTKNERIDKRNVLSQAVAHLAKDSVLNALLRSYSAAVKDSQNELIHLYEIRETLKKHFRSQQLAIEKLNLNKSEWDTLGRLANKEPLLQGRHRGEQFDSLRDASDNELNQARAIARSMIEKYVHYAKPIN